MRESTQWRTSQVPAPAVIPAPQAYTNVAVVKTFVVRESVFRRLTGLGQLPSLKGNFWGFGGTRRGFVYAGRSQSLGEACRVAFSFSSGGARGFMVSAGEYDSQL